MVMGVMCSLPKAVYEGLTPLSEPEHEDKEGQVKMVAQSLDYASESEKQQPPKVKV